MALRLPQRIARDLDDVAHISLSPSSSSSSPSLSSPSSSSTPHVSSVSGVLASPGIHQVDPNTQIIDATTTARGATAAVAPPVVQTVSSPTTLSSATPYPTTSHGPTMTAAAADPTLTSLITAGPAWSTATSTGAPKGLGLPIIVGIAVGGGVLVVALLSCCWLMSRKKGKAKDDLPSHSSKARRRSRILSRARPSPQQGGYARHDPAHPRSPTQLQRGAAHLTPPALSRAEARASVQMSPSNMYYSHEVLQPPSRTYAGGFDDAATTTTAWTDNSEMDVFAVDGSSYARTLSTVSRPNSEYDLEDDPGATYTGTYGTSTGTFSPFSTLVPSSSMASSAAQQAAQQRAQHMAREVQTPSPSPGAYPPHAYSPAGTFGPPTPGRVNAWREAPPLSQIPIGGVVSTPRSVAPSAPPPSQTTQTIARDGAGPSRQRIPAPKLLVDTKSPLGEAPPLSAMPSTLNSTLNSLTSTPLSAYPNWSRNATPEPYAARAMSPEVVRRAMSPEAQAQIRAPSRGAASTGTGRPLVTRQASRGAEDRPSALPYARDSRPPERERVVRQDARPGLTRGPTIIRHADAGAFEDVIPDDADEVHLPPAYDEIYST